MIIALSGLIEYAISRIHMPFVGELRGCPERSAGKRKKLHAAQFPFIPWATPLATPNQVRVPVV